MDQAVNVFGPMTDGRHLRLSHREMWWMDLKCLEIWMGLGWVFIVQCNHIAIECLSFHSFDVIVFDCVQYIGISDGRGWWYSCSSQSWIRKSNSLPCFILAQESQFNWTTTTVYYTTIKAIWLRSRKTLHQSPQSSFQSQLSSKQYKTNLPQDPPNRYNS